MRAFSRGLFGGSLHGDQSIDRVAFPELRVLSWKTSIFRVFYSHDRSRDRVTQFSKYHTSSWKNVKIYAFLSERDCRRPHTCSFKIKGGVLKFKKCLFIKENHKQKHIVWERDAPSAGHQMSGVTQSYLAPPKRGVPHYFFLKSISCCGISLERSPIFWAANHQL